MFFSALGFLSMVGPQGVACWTLLAESRLIITVDGFIILLMAIVPISN